MSSDPITTGHVDANGLRFAYLEAGAGPLALCMHGFPDTAETWRDLMPRLAEAGYRVVAPYMRGYAPSAIPDPPDYAPATLGRDVLALIEALGADEALLIGHDWGAAAVYNATALAPERVSRLIALAIPPPSTLKPSLRTLWGARHFLTFQLRGRAARRIRADDFAYLRTIYQRWSPTWAVPDDELEAVKACFAQPGVVEAALGYYWHVFKASRSAESRRLLRTRIAAPSLLLGGADDGGLHVRNWRGVERAFTAPVQVEILPGAGHFLHREAPERVANLILEWLDAP